MGRRTAKSATASYCWLLGICRLAPFSNSLRSSAGTKLPSNPSFDGAASNPSFLLSWLSERTPACVLAHGLWELKQGCAACRSLEAHPTLHAACQRCAAQMPTPRKLHPLTVQGFAAQIRPGHCLAAKRLGEVFGCCFHIVTLRNYFSFRTSSHHIHLLLLIDRSLQRRCTPPCKTRDSTPPAARRRCLCAYHGHMCISSSCVHIIVSVSR